MPSSHFLLAVQMMNSIYLEVRAQMLVLPWLDAVSSSLAAAWPWRDSTQTRLGSQEQPVRANVRRSHKPLYSAHDKSLEQIQHIV
jgi:hypothetical protein